MSKEWIEVPWPIVMAGDRVKNDRLFDKDKWVVVEVFPFEGKSFFSYIVWSNTKKIYLWARPHGEGFRVFVKAKSQKYLYDRKFTHRKAYNPITKEFSETNRKVYNPMKPYRAEGLNDLDSLKQNPNRLPGEPISHWKKRVG